MSSRRLFLGQSVLGALALGLVRPAAALDARSSATASPELLERAKALLAKAPLIDTHNDLPSAIIDLSSGDLSHLDLAVRQPKLCGDIPSLRAGRVGAQYWSIFVKSTTQRMRVALHEALREFDVALRFIRADADFEQARTADDIERIHRSGKIACLMGVEGGHMLESSPAVLRVFHELGARYVTLTHVGNVDWADSATDQPVNFGLTHLGRELVREMNRLGMFVDISHVSADTMRDALATTRAPVIFSHSCAFALNPHPRNAPDDVLRLLPANGGVIHVAFIRAFASPDGQVWVSRHNEAMRNLRLKFDDDASVARGIAEWEKSVGLPRAEISDVADHIDHIRSVAGIDHIGIGADFWHADQSDMVTGLGDVSRYPYLFAELLRRGYSDEDLLKIAGRNHLRAMRKMEQVAAELRRLEAPLITEGPMVG